jgi:hypothetical protein
VRPHDEGIVKTASPSKPVKFPYRHRGASQASARSGEFTTYQQVNFPVRCAPSENSTTTANCPRAVSLMTSSPATAAASDPQHAIATSSPAKPVTPSPAPKASKSLRPTGRLKQALDLMVFGPETGELAGCALAMDAAAREVGLTTRAIRLALDKPYVRQYINAQKHVFRTSASAQNISALVRLRDNSGNAMAQLGAIKTLEQLDDEQGPGSAPQQRAGMVIVVVRDASFPAEGNAERAKSQQIDLQPGEFNDAST